MREASTETVREIVRHYLRHPDTTDTFEGLVRWRLQEAQIDRTVEGVRQALEWLTERQILQVRTQGTHTFFQLNPDKLGDLQEILDSLDRGHSEQSLTE